MYCHIKHLWVLPSLSLSLSLHVWFFSCAYHSTVGGVVLKTISDLLFSLLKENETKQKNKTKARRKSIIVQLLLLSQAQETGAVNSKLYPLMQNLIRDYVLWKKQIKAIHYV